MGNKQSPSLRHRWVEIAQERKGRRELTIQMLLDSAPMGYEEVPAEGTENMDGGGEERSLELCFIGQGPAPRGLSYPVQELATS